MTGKHLLPRRPELLMAEQNVNGGADKHFRSENPKPMKVCGLRDAARHGRGDSHDRACEQQPADRSQCGSERESDCSVSEEQRWEGQDDRSEKRVCSGNDLTSPAGRETQPNG